MVALLFLLRATRSAPGIVLLTLIGSALGTTGHAQINSGAVVLSLEPSARSSAMGRGATAVFWGAFPDYYGNPALLGYHRGIRYEYGRTQLLPDLTDDIFFRSNRLTMGGFGVAISLSGMPFHGAGGMWLDYGERSTFHPHEEVNMWGIGVNGLEIVESLLDRDTEPHPWSRFGDVSWGYAAKDVVVNFFPGDGTTPEIKGRVTTHDHGLMVRLTPYDSIDHEGFLPGLDAAIAPLADGLRLDLSFGISRLNDSGETIEFTNDFSDRVARIERHGFGTRISLALPAAVRSDLEARGAGWLASALTPILSVGLAWDEEQQSYQETDGTEIKGLELGSNGVEITLFNVFSARIGEYETWNDLQNPERVTRNTWGYGIGFHVEGLGGAYVDRAQVELPGADLRNHEPTAFGFWLDPMGLWRSLRH